MGKVNCCIPIQKGKIILNSVDLDILLANSRICFHYKANPCKKTDVKLTISIKDISLNIEAKSREMRAEFYF